MKNKYAYSITLHSIPLRAKINMKTSTLILKASTKVLIMYHSFF